MSMIVEPICSEIEYTFLGIAVTNKTGTKSRLQPVDERAEEKKARSRRRTRAIATRIARRVVKGVFKFPLCSCRRSSTLDDDYEDDEFSTVTEYSRHIPYAPRKVPEALNQLVPYHAPEIVRSQHIPHVVQRNNKVPAPSSQLQRKVIIYPPNSGSTQQPMMSMNGQWSIGFETATRRESPLQGWSLTGDAYLGVGEPGLDFDSREDAIAYAQKYGWSYRVEGELVKHRQNKSIGTFGWVELMRPAVKT